MIYDVMDFINLLIILVILYNGVIYIYQVC